MGQKVKRSWRFTQPQNTFLVIRQMQDYAGVGINLFWQRQMIFGAALALAAYYYDARLALITLVLICLSETYDYLTFKKIIAWKGRDPRIARRFMIRLYLGTFLSAGIIVYYAVWISYKQGPTTHFMPLFFLFAAALFAAMNNHQLLSVLILRMIMYGLTFLLIPVWDIWVTGASIHSELWTQLFTSIFVLYFIIDCSRIYMNFYRTNMKQMDALRQEHEMTKQAYKAKSEFLSTMSHELRTPMTSINGSVSLALSGRLGEVPEKVAAVLSIAQRNCTRLSTLIDDILDLQKMESGKMVFDLKPMKLGAFVQRTVAINQPYADTFSVTFNTDIPAEDVYVSVDKSRLEQVMANLLSNAAKFSYPGGKVVVKIEASDDIARLLVIDQGVGLSEEHREKVFDQFSQIDSSDERKVGGTGLGMNISKRIIEAHDGIIDYFKNEGQGTTFFIDLKRLPDTASTEESRPVAPALLRAQLAAMPVK